MKDLLEGSGQDRDIPRGGICSILGELETDLLEGI